MRKIDRLGWAEAFAFECYGVKVGVRASKSNFLASLAQLLPPDRKPCRDTRVHRIYSFIVGGQEPGRVVRALHLMYGDATSVARAREMEPVLHAFDADLRLYLGYAARRRVFVHAGVVGWKGRAIVIPGRTFTGKSTLVTELIKLGAQYYSDEYAVFDMKGMVQPFAKPISLRLDKSGRATRFSPESFGATVGRTALPVRLIVDTFYREGARWRPRQASRAAALLTLLKNTVSARAKPKRNLPVLRRAVSEAVVRIGARGEASKMACEILSMLDRDLESPGAQV